MWLPVGYTMHRNHSIANITAGKYDKLRVFAADSGDADWTTDEVSGGGWMTAKGATALQPPPKGYNASKPPRDSDPPGTVLGAQENNVFCCKSKSLRGICNMPGPGLTLLGARTAGAGQQPERQAHRALALRGQPQPRPTLPLGYMR
jgi:hypothetical protein